MISRVLVVDDYEPWCRYIASTLQDRARWQIVGEVSDGAEAVRQAAARRPDLILLDIGLPTINGIEAAHRILDHDRDARILFVSEHRSWDVAEAALGTGARGYVIKSDAGRELLPAMQAIVDGGRFVSAALGGRAPENAGDVLASGAGVHDALFCSDEAHLLDAWVRIAHDGLQGGDAVIIVSTAPRREQVRARLEARGADVRAASAAGRYQSIDVEDGLSTFTVEGWPDETHFWKAAASLVMGAARTAQGPQPRITLCGEIAPTLWKRGRGDAAVQLERLWHEATRTYNIRTLCGYCLPAAYRDRQNEVFRDLCAVHAAVHSR
jgi:CheY-like chemotaxis protein